MCGPWHVGNGYDPTRAVEKVLAGQRPFAQVSATRQNAAETPQIYEGTNQIQRMVMARQLLKDNVAF
ncbi:hypothetical protein DY240_17320 [Jiangella rhizosphaerae]|uniref:Uncharacterized protein n=1 Tax=Jiangella rhizosphaerae TaxID=2293569 RepID=A0A418KNR9_9ACTN|nr:hypothetical protein DY240_17320 [Jiangella rhizosphaerae]